MIIICALSSFTSLPPSVASPAGSAPSPAKPAEPITTAKISGDIKSLEQQIKSLNDLKTTQYDYLTDEDQKRLSDCESKLSALRTVKKLAEFADQLDPAKNNGNNILNNLCSGLETFLGFNAESKGYDGQGIVYSDLDRLCDGVMGFLSGVLEGVKDENEVTTYDKYISGGSNKLESVLTTLTTNIGSGRAGLAASVDAVKAWLEGYGNTLWSMTHNVTNELGKLRDDISGVYTTNINAGENLQEQLTKWTFTVDNIDKYLSYTEKQYVNKLDSVLANNIMHEMKPLQKVVKHLKGVAENPSFKDQAQHVDDQLTKQKESVERAINTQCDILNDTLADELGKISDKIWNLESVKKSEFANITRDVNAAKTHIKTLVEDNPNGFKQKYQTVILAKFDTINDLLKDVDKKGGKNGNSTLHESVDKISEEITKQVESALAEVKNLESAVQSTAKKGYDRVVQLVNQATGALSGLRRNVDSGLHKLKDEMNKPIENVINKLKEGIANAGSAEGVYLVIQNFQSSMDSETTPKLREWAEAAKSSGSLRDAMDKFGTFDNIFGKFKTVLTKLSEAQPGGIFYDALIKDLQQNVKNAIDAVKSSSRGNKFNEIFDQFVNQITKGQDGNAVYGKVEGIKNDVHVKQTENLPVEKTALQNSINLIEKDITASSGIQSSNVKAAIHKVLQKVEELQAVPEQVDNLKRHTQILLQQLKDELDRLQTEIGSIERSVKSAEEAFGKSIYDMNRAVSKAYHISIEAIENLKNELCDITRKAFQNVTNEIRLLFANGHQADLTALGNLVNEQKRTIEELIKVDKGNGVKGLFKWLFKGKGSELEKFRIEVTSPMKPEEKAKKLRKLSKDFKEHVDVICKYVENQAKTPKGEKTPEKVHNNRSEKVHDIQQKLDSLLQHISDDNALPDVKDRDLRRIFTFDHTFTKNLHSLTSALSAFTPTKFGESSSPILQAFKEGVSGLEKELGKAYVNRYSGGEKFDGELVITPQKSVPSDKSETIYTLTDEGRKGAKILLTLFSTLNDSWLKLRNVCMYNVGNQINLHNGRLGAFLRIRGYEVASGENTQDGELQNKPGIDGNKLNELCMKDVRVSSRNLLQLFQKTNMTANNSINLDKLISFIHDSLVTYREVCHLRNIGSLKQPCSIYEMLIWITGLPHNPVYPSLPFDGFSELFEKPEETEAKKIDESGPTVENFGDVFLPAYPKNITVESISGALTNVCHHSYNVLTAILGHGHSSGIYACDFSTNEHKFSYPSDVGKCIDMLIDISYRLYEQLFFLYTQCCNDDSCGGWLDCWYGQGIAGSSWNCNKLQCPNQAGNQMGNQSNNQIANQICGQTCDQHPKCGLKSPLQSFLEDGLKGFLPHHLTKVGCGVKCSVTNHRGMPCKTPMGFADISVAASRMSRGKRIKDLLEYYCGKPDSPLALICKYFRCLLQRPPQTLGEMFSFYHHLTDRWGMHGQEHKQKPFRENVNAANFGRTYDELNVYHLFSPSHSAAWKGHAAGSLGSLVCLSRDSVVCGPFLRPISHSIYETFSSKHADKYLSWIVYLTASFYDLLKKLYDECNSKCGARGSNCHVKACVKGCRTTSTTYQPPRYHDPKCKSIVQCNFTLPTLAKYGFVLGDPDKLNEDGLSHTKRTCRDFCNVFKEAFEKDSHLVQLFKAIDNFMFAIRGPFLWMIVALWSLSLFYLLCVMVGRLDVLHIKSHLRIPSSHKITAQSLLAAAQVGRLAKISYLQP